MKTFRLTLVLTLLSFSAFAQDFEVPKNYKLQNVKDYDIYEKEVIKCVNWLSNTPINEQKDKRKEANAFLIQWIFGSSKIHIEIKQEIVTFSDSPDLLMIFMGGWTKYSLETKNFDDKIKGTMAGIELVIDLYTKNKGLISKNKGAEKYIKMKEKGTLLEYVEKNAK
ncbi:MAG: hypothetical protein OEY34_01330 [Cyclobacteriaceae bacterium]|nr:hypothetical protein [Cyclobacteriaceae bacterium]